MSQILRFIGTEFASEELTVEGNICYINSIYQCSDSRYKENINTIDAALEKVAHLRGVTHNRQKMSIPTRDSTTESTWASSRKRSKIFFQM